VEIKTEADIAECPHDDKPTTSLSDAVFSESKPTTGMFDLSSIPTYKPYLYFSAVTSSTNNYLHFATPPQC